jgi:octaprenyl-diphosphate synthase
MAVKIFSPQDFPAYLPKLNSLYDDLFAGGKGFRSKLIQIISKPLKLSSEIETLLCQTIEFIHNASLLHDDLIDRSQLRRGKPAAWTKYTPEYAVLAGDYLLARVMVNLSGHGNIKLVQYTSEIISDLLEGEWLQDSVVGDFFISVPQLDRIHNLKTASLFKWCLKAPFIARDNYDKELHTILDEMGTLLGQLFQRSDDLLDYDIRNDEGKAILGDLKSGYLNSFGAFVAANMSRTEIDKMVKSKDMNDFHLVFANDAAVGKEKFLEKVNQFDEINVEKIKLYHHFVQQLQTKLVSLKLDEASTQLLVTILNSLTDLLYFRKKSS